MLKLWLNFCQWRFKNCDLLSTYYSRHKAVIMYYLISSEQLWGEAQEMRMLAKMMEIIYLKLYLCTTFS